MFSKQTVQKIYKDFCKNESGNVLLFSVVVLLFLVFVISVLSLSVVNRMRVVRKESDNNQITAVMKQYNQSVENSIQQIINENDELARYYVSRRYYLSDTTSFSQNGSNVKLDNYLSNLISTAFQLQIKTAMSNTSISSVDCAKTVFAYLMLRRSSATSLPTELKSIPAAINANHDSKLSVVSITINALNGISETNPSFSQITNAIKSNKDVMDIECELSYNTSNLLSNTQSMNSNLEYHVRAYPYTLSGIDIVKPGKDDLKNALIPLKYKIRTVMIN